MRGYSVHIKIFCNMLDYIINKLPETLQGRFRSETSQKVVSNIFWLITDLFSKLVTGVVIGALVARYLGPEQYGLLSYALSIIVISSAIAPLGLQGLVIKQLVNHPTTTQSTISTAFTLLMASSAIAYLALFGVAHYIAPSNKEVFPLLIIGGISLLLKPFDAVKYWFESQLKSKTVVLIQNSALLITSLIKLALIYYQSPITHFVWILVIESLVIAAGLLFALNHSGQRLIAISNTNFTLARELITHSWPLFLSSISVIVNLNLDKIMLGHLSNNTELGFYAVASNLSQICYTFPVLIGATLAPLLTKHYSLNRTRYNYLSTQTFSFLFWLSLAMSLVVYFASDTLITFVFGEAYIYSAKILSIQIFSTIFLYHISFRKRLLLIEGQQHFVFIMSLGMVVVNYIANYLLIPRFGGLGAAIASLSSWAFSALILPLFFKSTRNHTKLFFTTIFFRG